MPFIITRSEMNKDWRVVPFYKFVPEPTSLRGISSVHAPTRRGTVSPAVDGRHPPPVGWIGRNSTLFPGVQATGCFGSANPYNSRNPPRCDIINSGALVPRIAGRRSKTDWTDTR